jgi:hypothetical protein
MIQGFPINQKINLKEKKIKSIRKIIIKITII